MEKRTRRTFSRELKLDAIRLVKEFGYSVKRAEGAVGIHENCLRKWLKEERDILEKAAAFFAQHQK